MSEVQGSSLTVPAADTARGAASGDCSRSEVIYQAIGKTWSTSLLEFQEVRISRRTAAIDELDLDAAGAPEGVSRSPSVNWISKQPGRLREPL